MKDIYVYEGTTVLINKLDIKNQEELDQKERLLTTGNMIYLFEHPLVISSVFDIKKIHKFLFADLFEWAGENRQINIYKDEPILNGLSVEYSYHRNIDSDLTKLDKEFKSIDWRTIGHKEALDKIVVLIAKLWQIHCFREGNTRSVTLFLYFFMKQLKMKVNTTFIGEHSKYFRNALVMASIGQYSDYHYLTDILMDSISFRKGNENKYKTIRDYEVDKYEYQPHYYKD